MPRRAGRPRWHALIALGLSLLATGCITPSRMPATVMHPRVVDEYTQVPIAGAKVRILYTNSMVAHASPTFLTDADGVARMEVPAQWVGPGGLAGHYWRQLEVSAEGYQSASFSDRTDSGQSFDYSTFRLLLTPEPPTTNVYGAARVITTVPHPTNTRAVHSTFEVLDGPRAGTQFRLRVNSRDAPTLSPGTKFYLLVPVDFIEAETAENPDYGSVTRFVLRPALVDEPYQPPQAR